MAIQNSTAAAHPSPFINFMRGFWGRAIRVVAGLILVYLGFFVIGGNGGTIIGLVGIVPIVAGVANFCLLGPVFGVDLYGRPAWWRRQPDAAPRNP